MSRYEVAFLLGFAGLAALGCWYGNLLHTPVELERDAEEEAQIDLLLHGVDVAQLQLTVLSLQLAELEQMELLDQADRPFTLIAAGMQ
jgi:hypothetical protein